MMAFLTSQHEVEVNELADIQTDGLTNKITYETNSLKMLGTASLCRAQETPSVRDRRAHSKKIVRTPL